MVTIAQRKKILGIRARAAIAAGATPSGAEAAQLPFLKQLEARNPVMRKDINRQVQVKAKDIRRGQITTAKKRAAGLVSTVRRIKKRVITESDKKRAGSLTPEAQRREFGRVLVQTKPKLSDRQLRKAKFFTEEKQIREFGRVVFPTRLRKKERPLINILTFTFPPGHPKAGQKVSVRVGQALARKIQRNPGARRDVINQASKSDPNLFGAGKITKADFSLRGKIEFESGKVFSELERRAALEKRMTSGLIAKSIALGAIRGGLGVIDVLNPFKVKKNLKAAFAVLKEPRLFFQAVGKQFVVDPFGTVAEFIIFGKGLNGVGRFAARSPVGRFVKEEMYIRSMPIELRSTVRKIIKSAKVQEQINPFNVKSIKGVNFAEVKSLNKIEAKALKETLQNTDSVIFGSAASRALSKSKTPIPKDIDFATANINSFNQQFIQRLPKAQRKGYKIEGQKLIRTRGRVALYDIKPLGRIIPNKSIITRRGFLPVSGFVKKLKFKKGSILPTFKKKPSISRLEIPTQKIQKVGGLKLIGFGEQTTRKALGTIQVLIERQVRRAKDPQALLISLDIQLSAVKVTKPKTPFGRLNKRRRIRVISDAITMLKSKAFAKLLEKKVPGITQDFPLIQKISTEKLKKISPRLARKKAEIITRNLKKDVLKNRVSKRITPEEKQFTVSFRNQLSKLQKSRIPSKVPSRLPSRIPSRLPSRVPSRVPSRIPSRVPSKVPSRIPSRIPSKIKPSITPSKIPSKISSRLPVSKIPSKIPSRLPVSKIPSKIPSRLRIVRRTRKTVPSPRRIRLIEKAKKRKQRKLINKQVDANFIFLSDLESRLLGIKAAKGERKKLLRKGRVFTGFEKRRKV